MEQADKAVCGAAVCALLHVLAVGCPLLVSQLGVHLKLAGREVGVHRGQKYNVLCRRERLQQRGNVVDVAEHALNGCVIEEVAALGRADERQAARVHGVLEHLGIVVRHVAPRADLAALIACDFHFVQAAPPLRLLCVVRVACREPYAPGVRSDTDFDSHNYILPVGIVNNSACAWGEQRLSSRRQLM